MSKVGHVTRVIGEVIHAKILEPRVGEIYEVASAGKQKILAEVVGFQLGEALLMPFKEVRNIADRAEVVHAEDCLRVPVGDALLGRVVDALGHPIDREPESKGLVRVPVYAQGPDPFTRKIIEEQMPLGIKAIDSLLPCGYGQRVGIFASAGGGKSTLMGMIARFVTADVKVIVLVGERRRELKEFLEYSLTKDGLKSSVVVFASSDEPAVVRLKAAYTGMAIAEYFRDKGKRVVFMLDSVTRFARAQREIGLARGEPPTRHGFPPSVFAELPRLFERCGNTAGNGSITGLFTVLVEGDDFDEPVSDESKSLLDGHIILSGSVGYFPRIDLLRSESRVKGILKLNRQVVADRESIHEFLRYYRKNEQDMAFGFLEGEEGAKAKPQIDKLREAKAQVDSLMAQDYKALLVPIQETGTLMGQVVTKLPAPKEKTKVTDLRDKK